MFLQEAIGSFLRKRSYAAHADLCFRYLDQMQKMCDDNNSTFTKRECFESCGKLDRWVIKPKKKKLLVPLLHKVLPTL